MVRSISENNDAKKRFLRQTWLKNGGLTKLISRCLDDLKPHFEGRLKIFLT